jgi:hypothetical protein
MKNTVFLIIALMLSFSISSNGQTIEDLAELAADGLCSCVNETYSDIDNDVKRAMARIIKYQLQDDEDGIENYVAKLSTDLTSRIEEQAGLLEENDDLFQMCLDDMEEAMGELDFDEEKYDGITEEDFSVLMIESMREMTGCKFAYILMELGLEVQEDEIDNEDQVKVKSTKSKKSTNDSNGNSKKYEGTGGN